MFHFKHQTAQFKALDNISFDVKKGETIAFVGPSGCGKSYVGEIAWWVYIVRRKEIYFIMKLMEKIFDFDDLRSQIGFVTQDTQLFAGTIKENLLFVNPAATEEDLIDALT